MARKTEAAGGDSLIPRVRVQAGVLAAALKDVAAAVEGRGTIPILANVLFQAIGGKICLTATDLDLWVLRELASADHPESGGRQPDSAEWRRGARDFGMTVPAKPLLALLGEIEAEAMVTITAPVSGPDGEETRAVVRAGRSRFRLPVLPVADFPLAPLGDHAADFELSAALLAEGLAAVSHAISSEETRYYLNGVYLHVHQEPGAAAMLRLVATDGHRLARWQCEAPVGAFSFPAMIVPAKAAALLGKLLGHAVKANDAAVIGVEAQAGGARVQFLLPAGEDGSDGVTLMTKAIDGTFPDYARVIPADPPLTLGVDRLALARAVKRVAVLADSKSRILRAVLEEGRLTLRVLTLAAGEAEEDLACDFDGARFELGIDATYLRAALLASGQGADEADEVVLRLSDPGAAVRIEAGGEDPALVQVVMPARVG